jgi:hypothetical protein
MSGKIIAQIIISGLTIISKSLLTAYRQALQSKYNIIILYLHSHDKYVLKILQLINNTVYCN